MIGPYSPIATIRMREHRLTPMRFIPARAYKSFLTSRNNCKLVPFITGPGDN